MSTKTITIIIFLFLAAFKSFAQTDTEFWFAAPNVTTGHDGGSLAFNIRFSTFDLPAEVTISIPANPDFEPIVRNLDANDTETVGIDPDDYFDFFANFPPVQVRNRGVLIEATNNITAYFEISTPYNPDIYSLKGNNALGTEFYVPFQNRFPNGSYTPEPYSSIDIVATQDNTVITVNPTNPVLFHGTGEFTITLNKGQTYSIVPHDHQGDGQLPENRLGGTKVTSNNPIAIITSDDSVIGQPLGCRDVLGDQIIPTDIIGTEYIAMKGRLTIPEYFYVIATQDNTEIYLDTEYEETIDEGETFRHEFTKDFYHIETNHPAYVYHVAGFGCEMGAAILPPINICTGSSQVSFTRSKGESFFLNILVRAGAEDGFILNDDETLINADDFSPVYGTTDWLVGEFEFGEAVIGVGDHSLIQNTKDVFHLGIINGAGATGVLYGYFSDFNEMEIDAFEGGTGSDLLRGCYGEAFQLVASGGINYQWSPPDYLDNPYSATPIATPPHDMEYWVTVSGACNMIDSTFISILIADPVIALFDVAEATGCAPFDVTITDYSMGVSVYSWRYGDGQTSDTKEEVHTYTYTNDTDEPLWHELMLVGRTGRCRDTMHTNIVVFPEIEAKIVNENISGCAPVTVNFEEDSRGAANFLWNFGDGNTTTDIEPTHTFHNYGDTDTTYTVVLQTLSEYGCVDYDTIEVHVRPYVRSGFEFDPPSHCNPYEIEITNTSVGAVTNMWDFDDGEGQQEFNEDTIHYTLVNPYDPDNEEPKTFDIQLITSNPYGCADTLTRQATVYPYLEAGFESLDSVGEPVIAGCNPLTVQFNNTSKGAETFYWHFDKEEGSSSEENPVHVFNNPSSTEEAVYNVQLTVTSEYGCVDTISTEITVYPRLKAGFTFEHSSYCGPHDVIIYNNVVGTDSVHWDFDDGNEYFNSDGDFVHTFENTTGVPQTYTITQTVINEQGCEDVKTRDITIYPEITADFEVDFIEGCHPLTVDFTNLSEGEDTYHWVFDDGGTSSQESPERTFKNSSHTEIKNFFVQLIVESEYGCIDSITKRITVFPKPKAALYLPVTEGCSPLDVSFEDQSIIGDPATFEWTFDDGESTSTTPGDIDHIYHHPGDDLDLHVFYPELIITNEYGCKDTTSKEVVVYPDIEADFTVSDIEGCHPLEVTLENHSSGATGETPYQWNYGDGNTSTNEDNEHTHVFRNFDHWDIEEYTIKLLTTSKYGCIDSSTVDITVWPKPKANYEVDEHTGCSPHEVDFTDLSIGGNEEYLWTFGDGGWSDVQGNVSHVYEQPPESGMITHTSQLKILNSYGCADSLQKNINIYPAIEAEIATAETNECTPVTITFENASLGATSYLWDFRDGTTSTKETPEHTFYNYENEVVTKTVLLRATSEYGCVDHDSVDIHLSPFVKADFNFNPPAHCNPYEIEINNSSIGAATHTWDFDDNMGSFVNNDAIFYHTLSNQGSEPDTFNIKLIAANTHECADTLTRKAVVYPYLEASFVPRDEESIPVFAGCNPLTVYFDNQSTGENSYYWSFGEGEGSSSEENPVHTFHNFSTTETADFNVELTVTSEFGCQETYTEEITVYPRMVAGFSLDHSSYCAPHEVVIHNHAEGAETVHWDFGDGTTTVDNSAQITHTFETPDGSLQEYTIKQTVRNGYGCEEVKTRVITIYPEIEADFEITPLDDNYCHPLSVTLANNSSGEESYYWDFGDGGTSTEPVITRTFKNNSHTNEKVYNITLAVESGYGCKSSITRQLTVNPKPKAVIDLPVSSGCPALDINFIDQSLGGDNYLWDFDDGSDPQTTGPGDIEHTYYNSGDATLNLQPELIITNQHGCKDTTYKNVAVYPGIEAGFTVSENSGCHPLEITIFNNTDGATASTPYKWNYGDGNTSTNNAPEHTHVFKNFDHENEVVNSIKLLAKTEHGCVDSSFTEITVYPVPKALYSVDEHTGCSPHTVEFIDGSIGGNNTYNWSFGDGETSAVQGDVSHEYLQPADAGVGIFMSELEITNNYGCSDIFNKAITVYPHIEANFTGVLEGCHPLTVEFENLSDGVDSYQWSFDDGNYSNKPEPVNEFLNTSHTDLKDFDVELWVTSQYGCEDNISKTVTVYPRPKVDFSTDITDGCSPLEVVFEDSSTGVDQYEWDFDNGTSETSDPLFEHIFVNTGTGPNIFNVHLTGSNQWGCFREASKAITVYPEVEADFTTATGDFAGCSPFYLDFINQSELAEEYKWSFGQHATSTNTNPTHGFYNDGNNEKFVDIKLLAISQYNCRDSIVKEVTVFPQPAADFEAIPYEQTFPSRSITIHNYSSEGVWIYDWDMDDGNTFTKFDTESFDHTFEWPDGVYNARDFDIVLRVYNEYCYNELQQRVSVSAPEPQVGFSPSKEGCPPLEVQFVNESLYGYYFHWNFDDGNFSDEQNPVHVFEEPGVYNVKLTVTGAEDIDSTKQVITVFEPPIADFNVHPREVKIPHEPVQMINLSSLGSTYEWYFGDGTTSWDYEPEHYYSRGGVYDITLIVGNDTDPQCFDQITKEGIVRAKETCKIVFPNAFAPLEEGPTGGHYSIDDPSNHIFHPLYDGIDEYTLEIYNRWGELIFRSTDINIGWDGYYRDRLVNMGVYVWKVNARCFNGEKIERTGDVTVIR